MKILYLSAAVLPAEKSHSLSIMRMCQAFTDEGHEVTLSGVRPAGPDADPVEYYGLSGGFSIVRCRIPWLLSNRVSRKLLLPGLWLAWKTRRLARKERPDIIYSRLTIAELALVPKNVPIIYEMHSLGPIGKGWPHRAAFLLLLKWKNVRRIIVTTDALAEMLRSRLPVMEVVVARLSAELPVMATQDEIDEFRRRHLQGEHFPFHVGYTGYMDRRGLRGTDVIIKVAKEMPDVAFHLVGGEPHIVKYWQEYANTYNEHQNIFFYGYRNPTEMPLFLSSFDVVLAPLQFRPAARAPLGENMSPLKLPQYMAYGKAIVASDLPAHRECLDAGRTAELVPSDDIRSWCEAIYGLLQDPVRRQRMGKYGSEKYLREFTPAARVERILCGL